MKLQRWGMGNPYCVGECEDGDFVRYEDCAALEAENESLRAEIKCLKAPPKVLSAEEVTEPGFYWHNLGPKNNDWLIDRVVRYGVLDDLHIMNAFGGYYPLKHMHGPQFIGPLTPPEV